VVPYPSGGGLASRDGRGGGSGVGSAGASPSHPSAACTGVPGGMGRPERARSGAGASLETNFCRRFPPYPPFMPTFRPGCDAVSPAATVTCRGTSTYRGGEEGLPAGLGTPGFSYEPGSEATKDPVCPSASWPPRRRTLLFDNSESIASPRRAPRAGRTPPRVLPALAAHACAARVTRCRERDPRPFALSRESANRDVGRPAEAAPAPPGGQRRAPGMPATEAAPAGPGHP